MRVQICFRGRVQGVGFRATAVHCARGLAVTGFVRNDPDGSVLLEAQGDPGAIELLLSRITERTGRNITRADRIDLADVPAETGFQIRH